MPRHAPPIATELLQATKDAAGVAVSRQTCAGIHQLPRHKAGGRPGQGGHDLDGMCENHSIHVTMFVYIYVCIYIYIHTHIILYIYICIYIYMFTYVCILTCVY